jgi:hypothetical protein
MQQSVVIIEAFRIVEEQWFKDQAQRLKRGSRKRN